MSKHTEGPWYAAQPDHCNGWWVVSTDPEGDECIDESGDGGFTEKRARFIASAPELLASLKKLLADWDGVCSGKGWDKDCLSGAVDARIAISKAEGA